ncbi:hypothetical protein PLICRDRAFT_93037 [Plicaturopsis crispa FD-325 SS-3]|nr:hypothetical protein PLICRDRAFT_93037 [Plicaturopsis crispa FD-325 SS-3]
MQEAEEQDTCRICSAPAEPDQPLFHPCKCAGTIRYIHQDCLTTWLAHSKKKDCDVCKHPYSFNKVYAADMPARLPTFLVLRHLAQQSFFAVIFCLRAVVVGCIWLAVLPWITVWTWRMYFTMGDLTAWWLSDRPRPTQQPTPTYQNETSTANSTSTLQPFLFRYMTGPSWRSLSADIFAGQIIASLIVLTFVAVFLLREWILQNARPGVLDDDELPAEERDAHPNPQPLPPPNPAPRIPPRLLAPPPPMPPVRPIAPLPPVRAPTINDDPPREAKRIRVNYEDSDDKGKGVDREGRAFPRQRSQRRVGRTEEGEEDSPTEAGSSSAFQFTFRAGGSSRNSISSDDSPLRPTPSFKLSEVFESESLRPSSSGPTTPRRPPLPTTALTPPLRGSAAASRIHSPMASPSLATYRAPEELEAGPSRFSGYFDQDEHDPADGSNDDEIEEVLGSSDIDADMDMLAEHERYFQEVGDDSDGDVAARTYADVLDFDDEEEDKATDGSERFDDDGDMDDEPFDEDDPNDDDGDRRVEGVAQGAPVPPDQAAQDLDDDLDGNVEDDMEGAMEAIGLRGPIHGVVQNLALMVFVLDSAIGLAVWLPFTIGKSTALLFMNPPRLLELIHLPIRCMRVITDPIVDSVMFLLMQVLLPSTLRTMRRVIVAFLRVVSSAVAKAVEQLLGKRDAATVFRWHAKISQRKPWEQIMERLRPLFDSPPPAVEPKPSGISAFLDAHPAFARVAEPYFASLGNHVRRVAFQVQSTWTRFALGNGTSEKVFAVGLGYVVTGILIAVYLNVLTVGNMKNAGRAVRSAVRQQLLVVKVASFIVIELAMFPLGCGVMLDLCTVWIFPEASLHSRVWFFLQSPMTAMFYHWVAGTMFMYQFAILLSGCRGLMRPGAMWFIKDPQDQNFHPIRDILERPTFLQLRKLFVSAVMYAIVVACGVASIGGILMLGHRSILPFRWKNREPLSNIPIDLLFLHLVLPSTMHYFRPKEAAQGIALHVWKYLAARLRLTSYMLGEHLHTEQYTPKRWSWSSLFSNSGVGVYDPDATHDGTFRRVPATDNIALPRDMRATVEVDRHGAPVDKDALQLMIAQNVETERARRSVKDDYMVVYIPPHFRYRVMIFVALLWVVGCIVAASLVALPIEMGRMLFSCFVDYPVHDGYSWIVGFYLFWGCAIFGKAVNRMDRHRQRRSADGPRAKLPLYVLKHGLVWMAKVSYMMLFLGVVIPTLLAVVVELYLVLPMRLAVDPAMSPRIRVVDMWALGLIYVKIALRVQRYQPPNQVTRGVANIMSNGWSHPDPIAATREIILPVTAGLLGMILLPGGAFRALHRLFPALPLDGKFLFMHVYPGIFAMAGSSRTLVVGFALLKRWIQSIRDKEFLVEMRLRNHDPVKESNDKGDGPKEANAVAAEESE